MNEAVFSMKTLLWFLLPCSHCKNSTANDVQVVENWCLILTCQAIAQMDRQGLPFIQNVVSDESQQWAALTGSQAVGIVNHVCRAVGNLWVICPALLFLYHKSLAHCHSSLSFTDPCNHQAPVFCDSSLSFFSRFPTLNNNKKHKQNQHWSSQLDFSESKFKDAKPRYDMLQTPRRALTHKFMSSGGLFQNLARSSLLLQVTRL